MKNSKRLGLTGPKTKTKTRQSSSKKAQVKVELVVGEIEIGYASTARLVPSRRQPLGRYFSCSLEIRQIPALGGLVVHASLLDDCMSSSLITGPQEPNHTTQYRSFPPPFLALFCCCCSLGLPRLSRCAGMRPGKLEYPRVDPAGIPMREKSVRGQDFKVGDSDDSGVR